MGKEEISSLCVLFENLEVTICLPYAVEQGRKEIKRERDNTQANNKQQLNLSKRVAKVDNFTHH